MQDRYAITWSKARAMRAKREKLKNAVILVLIAVAFLIAGYVENMP